MLRRAKKHQKKLAKVVLAALLCTGGAQGLMSPSVAEAAGSITVTGYSNGAFTPDGSMVVISESGYYRAYPTDGNVTVLNLAPGETDTWTGGNSLTVYGHYAEGASGDTAVDASGYTVKMTGAKAQVNYLAGGYAQNEITIDASGGTNDTGNVTAAADKNTVTVSGGAAVNSDVYGGYAYAYAYAYDGATNTAKVTASASENTVTISAAAVNGDVYGGAAYAYAYAYDGATNTSETTAEASKNTVIISDGAKVGDDIYGGSAYSYVEAYVYETSLSESIATAKGTSSVNENTITISGDAKVEEDVYGGYNYTYTYAIAYDPKSTTTAEGTVNANSNTITISDEARVEDVYGGYNYTYTYAYGYDSGSSATVEQTDNANNNTVTISGTSAVEYDIYGGLNYNYIYSYAYDSATATVKTTANANNNTITISDKAKVGDDIYGGYNYNYIYVYAYYSGTATAETTVNANNNTITISGDAAVDGGVYGGQNYNYTSYIYAYDYESNIATVKTTANANSNTITISDNAKVGDDIYGGSSSSYAYYIYSYYASSIATAEGTVNANNNTITISDAAVGGDVYGGESDSSIYYGYAYYGGEVILKGTANANENTVTISGAAAVGEDAEIYGGYAYTYVSTVYAGEESTADVEVTANANENTVTISGAAVGEDSGIYGGYANAYAYYVYAYDTGTVTVGVTASASDNTITISDSAEIKADVYGGMAASIAYFIYADGENTATGEVTASADNNTVIINDAAVEGTVYGGFTNVEVVEADSATVEVTATANNNKVKLKDATISGNVYGGATSSYSSVEGVDVVTGNTLIISGVNTVKAVDGATAGAVVTNFETIKLDETLEWNTEAPVLTADLFADNADGTRAALDVSDVKADFAPAEGGQMTILASETTDDFATLALTYSGGSETLNESKQSQVVKDEPISDEEKGVAVVIQTVHTVSLDEDNSYKNVLYSVENETKGIALKEMKWGEGRDLKGKYTFDDTMTVDATDLTFTGAATTALKAKDSMALATNATGLTTANKVTEGTDKTVSVDHTDANGINFGATATGHVESAKNAVNYVVDSVALDSVDLAGWKGMASAVPEGWTAAANVSVETDGMTAPAVEAGKQVDILQGGAADFFANATINGANAYKDVAFTDTDSSKTVTVSGTQGKGVKASEDGADLVYAAGKKNADTVKAGALKWQKDAVLFDGSDGYDYSKVASIGTDSFEVTYGDGVPETLSAGDSMTLLKANETLKDMAAAEKKSSYSFTPVSGVTVDAAVTGKLAVKDGVLTYTAAENRADKLTFGDVQWSAGSPLLKRPSNIIFAGADVDTAKINFVNMSYLDANQKMTLVSDFGDSVGTITGSKYMVGTAFEGEGTASLKGNDLIFTTKTEAGLSEQTHKTVMAMDAGLAMLKTGNEFIGKAIDGLADVRNRGKDGVSTFASVGGGASRYSTGSHVNTHTWNAVVGVGKKTETKQGTVEYGIFGEYGKGSYTLHSNAGNGDGDAHHAGGGVLAKFTNKHNVYAEGSIRAGRMSDSSSDIMRDGLGNAYGYDVHASYYGAHLGAGKIINYKDGKSLDVYGKFFYLKRDGVEYDAVQHYNLDSVSSSILRLGARYGTTDKKWNWYGGLAYEYEFDGEAKGTVNGKEIRAASIRGSSVRGEFGMRMDATKDNPWSTDISLYGYGGKHRGFGGNVSVAYTF